MNIEQKKANVEELKEILASTEAMILVTSRGLTVNQTNGFRRDLDKEGAGYRVVKNSLFARAVQGSGREFLGEMLEGPLAIAYTKTDPATLAKTLAAFIKATKKVEIKGGCLGDKPIGEADIKLLAALPPLETLKGMFLGTLSGVPRKFLGLLQAPGRDFVGVLKARENQLNEQAN
ncbi:MAG: 50S ribosomal protein L10 [Deltaproteobacteria bacterium]|nr:50S ribosomal protein L10 [Deltaproteobacteria bacterium]